jgi:hypothetical protein
MLINVHAAPADLSAFYFQLDEVVTEITLRCGEATARRGESRRQPLPITIILSLLHLPRKLNLDFFSSLEYN